MFTRAAYGRSCIVPTFVRWCISLFKVNNDVPINKADIKRVFLQRTIFERSPNVAKNILLKLPFEYMKAVWLKTIICTQDILFDFDDAFAKFTSEIEALFAGDTEN